MRLLKTALVLIVGAVTIQPLHAQAVIGNGLGPQTTVAWVAATAQNAVLTSQLAFGTPVGGASGPGYSTVVVAFNASGSITGGVITFEATTDPNGNTNWQGMTCSRIGLAPAADPTYTLTGANQVWQCDVAGLTFFRTRLSTVITGTGTANLTSQASVAVPSYELAYSSATQLAAAINNGATLYEKGPRWQVNSQPAVASQATASKAAGAAGVRHVADCVSFSGGSIAATTVVELAINLRDGASGAGTIIWTQTVGITATPGQNVAPFSVCGLNLIGTAATAMTIEFSAGDAGLAESVSLTGFDVQ